MLVRVFVLLFLTGLAVAYRCDAMSEGPCIAQYCAWCPQTNTCLLYNPCDNNTAVFNACPGLVYPWEINCSMYNGIIYTSFAIMIVSMLAMATITLCSVRFGCKRDCININMLMWPCICLIGIGLIIAAYQWSLWNWSGDPYYYNYALNTALIMIAIPAAVVIGCALLMLYFVILYCINPRHLRTNLRKCNTCVDDCCGRGVRRLYAPALQCWAWVCDKVSCSRQPIYPDIFADSDDDGL